MNDTLFEKAQIAEDRLERFSEIQLAELRPLVAEIMKLEREMDALLIRLEAAERCRECTKICCGKGMENLFDEYSFLFVLFDLELEIKYRIWKLLQNEPPQDFCLFLGKNGCILPSDKRLFICKIFLCERFGPAGKLTEAFSERLNNAFYELAVKVRQLSTPY